MQPMVPMVTEGITKVRHFIDQLLEIDHTGLWLCRSTTPTFPLTPAVGLMVGSPKLVMCLLTGYVFAGCITTLHQGVDLMDRGVGLMDRGGGLMDRGGGLMDQG